MSIPKGILMVRPAVFGPNEQTAGSNAFQSKISFEPEVSIRKKAIAEFDTMVKRLEAFGVDVLVVQDTEEPPKPDAVFPNNWLATFPDGTVMVFPMMAVNRRIERRKDILDRLRSEYRVERVVDLSPLENEGEFLEGTGSLILDHDRKKGYACRSSRTTQKAVEEFERQTGYDVFLFKAFDASGMPIYHTNVMMFITSGFAAFCPESIRQGSERKALLDQLSEGREVIPLSYYQMTQFAGNMAQLRTRSGADVLLCSSTAYRSLDSETKRLLENNVRFCVVDIPTIEQYGGGSARCMIAEIFLEK